MEFRYTAATADGTWDAWLIECEGVHRSSAQKTIDRDDRKLIRSFDLAGADSETLSQLVDCLERATTAELSRAA